MKISKLASATLALAALSSAPYTSAQTFDEIGDHYAHLAEAVYTDSLGLALELEQDIQSFLEAPGQDSLANAKASWTKARKVYGMSEVFRFSHPVVDEWEPQVNAWPLDEGFIDYVQDDNYYYELGNPVGKANLIASESLKIGPELVDLSKLTPDLLASLNEIGGTEANVATGWHAIEFLLWGQDLNGTNAGAGDRPYTDFLIGENCTNGHCERRREYLQAVTSLLISDLQFIVSEWVEGQENYRASFEAMSAEEKMRRVLYGMGSLALGELAGERMKVALYANSPEDEHDCFSDTTHNTLYANAAGIHMALDGSYTRISGEELSGPSLLGWSTANSEISDELEASASSALSALMKIVESAENGEPFDQLIAPGNSSGKTQINSAIDALKALTLNIELLAGAMELGKLNPDDAGHEF